MSLCALKCVLISWGIFFTAKLCHITRQHSEGCRQHALHIDRAVPLPPFGAFSVFACQPGVGGRLGVLLPRRPMVSICCVVNGAAAVAAATWQLQEHHTIHAVGPCSAACCARMLRDTQCMHVHNPVNYLLFLSFVLHLSLL